MLRRRETAEDRRRRVELMRKTFEVMDQERCSFRKARSILASRGAIARQARNRRKSLGQQIMERMRLA